LLTKRCLLICLAVALLMETAVSAVTGDSRGAPGFHSLPVSPERPAVVSTDQAAAARGRYHVLLRDPPVATYRGGKPGLAATSAELTGRRKLDAKSAASRAYQAYLGDQHASLTARVALEIGRQPKIVHHLYHALNEMAMELTADEAARVRDLPGVLAVRPEHLYQLQTDAGPAFIGAADLWTHPRYGNAGEGVIIGVIDTGINFANPSFADIGDDGYDHDNPLGPGHYLGVCNAAEPGFDPTFGCNDKLIGAWGHPEAGPGSPVDDIGHGSHTASIAAGNVVTATVQAPTLTQSLTISGVAPHASIIVYDACSVAGCPGTALSFAINQAVLDGVDVINYSIGGEASDPWRDFDSLGFKSARAAGIFVTAAAGNQGPAGGTLGSPANAPWLTAVANSSHDRVYRNQLTAAAGGVMPLAPLVGQGYTSGYGPRPILHARGHLNARGVADDGLCLSGFPAGTWSNGEILVCDRGKIPRLQKGMNVLAGGAGGMVLANHEADGESTNSDLHVLPAVHLGFQQSQQLRGWLAPGSDHWASIAGAYRDLSGDFADRLARSSSRGPDTLLPDLIKPDLSAPGSDILAAAGEANAVVWGFMSGTSMASPHVAGAAALLRNAHPDWSPAEIQSALMSTGVTTTTWDDGTTPTDPFDVGGGRLDLATAAAAAVVLDETDAAFSAADPANGGDPTGLNLAGLGNHACPGRCSWTRTLRSTVGQDLPWSVRVIQPPGWEIRVKPREFVLPAGGSQTLTIQARATSLPGQGWSFGQLSLQAPTVPVAAFPIALAFAERQARPEGGYVVSTNAQGGSCDTGFGGYLDLLGVYGIPADPAIAGDGRIWTVEDFSADFFGEERAGVGITDDGYVVLNGLFALPKPRRSPQRIPDPARPNSLVAALWSDLEIRHDPVSNSGVTVAASDDGSLLVIEYDDPLPAGGAQGLGDFEIMLRREVDHSKGVPEVMIAFANIDPDRLPAVVTNGVEDPAGVEATALLNAEDPVSLVNDGLVVCYDYVEACPDYLRLGADRVSGSQTREARLGILAGADYSVDPGARLSLNRGAGGVVRLYPGFRIRAGGQLRVDAASGGCR